MPLGDGTGPLGLGPRTGRGRGRCLAGVRSGRLGRVRSRHRGGWLWGIALPVAAAALRDLANPAGLLRRTFGGLVSGPRRARLLRAARGADYDLVEQPDETPSVADKSRGQELLTE